MGDTHFQLEILLDWHWLDSPEILDYRIKLHGAWFDTFGLVFNENWIRNARFELYVA